MAREMIPVAAAVALAWPLPAAEAIITRHDTPDQAYLDLGQAPQLAPVGRVQRAGASSTVFEGSGTLITPDLVLTAAHVVDTPGDPTFSFQLDSGLLVTAAEVIIHPSWTGNITGGGDIALVRLAEPVLDVAPAHITSGVQPFGEEVMIAGYGGPGVGLTGWDGTQPQLRRAATNILEPLFTHDSDEFYTFDFDFPEFPIGSTGATELEGMGMFGDSGGPVMAFTNDRWEIIGTNSYIWDIDGDNPGGASGLYYDIHGATRLLPYRDWINQNIPAPGAAITLLAAGVGLSRRRRAAR